MPHKSSVEIPIRMLFEKSLGIEYLESELQKVTSLLEPFTTALRLNIDLSSIKTIDQLIEKLNELGMSVSAAQNKLTLSTQNAAGINGSVTLSKNVKGELQAAETYNKQTLSSTRELITVYQQLEGSIRQVQSLERQGITSGEAYNLASNQVQIYRSQLETLIASIQGSAGAATQEEQAQIAAAQAIITKRNADIQLLEATHQATLSQQQQQQATNEYLSIMNQVLSAETRLASMRQGGSTPQAITTQQQYINLLRQKAAALKSNITDAELLAKIEQELAIAQAKANAQMQQGSVAIKKQQSLFGSLAASMKMVIKTALLYSLAYGSIYKVTEAFKSTIDTVKELDKAVVDLRIVTGGTQETAEKLLSTYNKMAQELGSTTTEVADAAVEWQRQGYSLADTNKLIENSMILSKVGMIESAEAQKYLTSAMKGYNVSVDESLGIVDKLTAIDLNAAVSAGDLAEAMSRTAASADLAGVEMDELLGYMAVVGEVTQKSMSSVGESKIIDALKVA